LARRREDAKVICTDLCGCCRPLHRTLPFQPIHTLLLVVDLPFDLGLVQPVDYDVVTFGDVDAFDLVGERADVRTCKRI
jgi:hypothetical protein